MCYFTSPRNAGETVVARRIMTGRAFNPRATRGRRSTWRFCSSGNPSIPAQRGGDPGRAWNRLLLILQSPRSAGETATKQAFGPGSTFNPRAARGRLHNSAKWFRNQPSIPACAGETPIQLGESKLFAFNPRESRGRHCYVSLCFRSSFY